MSNWRPSTVTEEQLQDFAEKVLLLSKEVAHWRPPPARHEEPQPEADEIMSFLAFYKRKLRHLVHPFLLGLLNKWGLQL
jgi:hypothetical protein